MNWTTEKPSTTGWYWWRKPSMPLIGVMVRVDIEADTVHSSGMDGEASLDKLVGGEWFGPLEMPQ
jgi:hypothetical protein